MPTDTAVITSAWVPPPVITGFSGSAIEEDSLIRLNWSVSTLSDTDFGFYRIYRRLIGAPLWDIIEDITSKATVSYEDVTAAQATDYEYLITQFKLVVGDVPLESDQSEIVTIRLSTDAWFIIMSIGGNHQAMEVNVVEEQHQAVIQQEVFEPLASNRKRIVRGNVMGDEGNFTATVDTADVQEYKVNFDLLSRSPGPHILKSPFGDVWYTEFDAPGFKYRTGGHMDVTIGWVEI